MPTNVRLQHYTTNHPNEKHFSATNGRKRDCKKEIKEWENFLHKEKALSLTIVLKEKAEKKDIHISRNNNNINGDKNNYYNNNDGSINKKSVAV